MMGPAVQENTMPVELAQLGSYLEGFTEFVKETAAETPPWLRELREKAFAQFCAVGFPTTRDEDWRFTNVSALARTQFKLARGNTVPFATSDLVAWRMEDAAARMVFVDGRFAPELSTWGALPEGVTANGLHKEIQYRPQSVADHLGRYLDIERDPFCALNTAFIEDGAYVHVRRGVVVKHPIHLLFIVISAGAPAMTHPRNLIVVEDEGEASIVEEYVSFGQEMPAFSNTATELVAGSNATVTHTMVEREHLQSYNFSTLRIEQARSATVTSHSLLLGGALVRNNVHPVLAGEGGECLINGLFIGGGRQHLDNYMLVEHASPHCASRQFYNGILDERAHGVFHGRIIVHKDAQKTDAKQTNRNLLLNDDAQIDTKPQLEIYADDVKCTHGATIGQIEENALFYLRSRGITESDARRLLLQAFAGEFLDRMKTGAVRDYSEQIVLQRWLEPALGLPREPGSSDKVEERRWEEVR
jgi:Fe-S cluster assembly protein SufD